MSLYWVSSYRRFVLLPISLHANSPRMVLSCFVTDVVKNAVGRPRPDLIDRCKPAAGTPDHQLVTIGVCTELDHHTLHDGWRSFPSGHSSFAFAGLGFLSLFFSGQLHVFRPRTDLGRALFALAPILGAAMIAISRCEDYRLASTFEEWLPMKICTNYHQTRCL